MNDWPVKLAAHPNQPIFAAGYVSGFIWVFDALANKTVLDTMIYESPVRDITFSKNVKYMASI